MNKGKKVTFVVMLLAVVLMAVGYAALSNVELEIGGSASAIADDANFKVWFTGVNTKTSSAKATVAVTAQATEATVTIEDLITVGAEEYVILEIENASTDIDATSVTVTTNEESTEYIGINAVMCEADGTEVTGANPLAVSGKTYVKVSAKLLQTITSPKSTNINVIVTAVPEELN